MIDLQGVSRSYVDGDRTIHALREITLRIPPRQTVAVVGMSGSGKSTLLHQCLPDVVLVAAQEEHCPG